MGLRELADNALPHFADPLSIFLLDRVRGSEIVFEYQIADTVTSENVMNCEAGTVQAAETAPPLRRITRDPLVMQGRACIQGMGVIVGHLGAGRTIEDVLNDFSYFEREDILEALQYAA